MTRAPYKRKSFSASEDEKIIKMYGKIPSIALAKSLGRTLGSVQHRARKLGVAKKLRPFSEADVERLKNMKNAGLPLKVVAEFFGKSQTVISTKAREVGLGKWRSPSGRVKGRLIDGFKNSRAIYTHRAAMEKIIGRKLDKSEIVHHIDGDIDNNNPSNLHLFKSRAEHLRAHKSAGKRLKELFQRGLIAFNPESGLYALTDSSVSITPYNSK